MKRCHICKLNIGNNKSTQLGGATFCSDCLVAISVYLNATAYEPQEAIQNGEFEILYQADMSLRVFRRAFPLICHLESFKGSLKKLEDSICQLEVTLSRLSGESEIEVQLTQTLRELKVLHDIYI